MSSDFTRELLLCTSPEYQEFFNRGDDLCDLVKGAEQLINENGPVLRQATEKCHLDILVSTMLNSAPHPQGQRYVTTVIHVAHKHGSDALVAVAVAWMDNLFFKVAPYMQLVTPSRDEEDSDGTPGPQTDPNHERLRKLVGEREQYRCAVSGVFDIDRLERRKMGETNSPIKPYTPMDAVYILPPSLSVFSPSSPLDQDAPFTFALFRAWTGMDANKLAVTYLNSPANAIYMSTINRVNFYGLDFYLEPNGDSKDPMRYKATPTFEHPNIAAFSRAFPHDTHPENIEFHSMRIEDQVVPVPDAELLRIHAALAKVLHLSDIVAYVVLGEIG